MICVSNCLTVWQKVVLRLKIEIFVHRGGCSKGFPDLSVSQEAG